MESECSLADLLTAVIYEMYIICRSLLNGVGLAYRLQLNAKADQMQIFSSKCKNAEE